MSGQSHRAKHDTSRVAEDRALFARYLDQRDPVDREMLVERFLPLARQLARRYQRPDEPFDDLFQVACLGLINAIDRFSLEREVAFSASRCRPSWGRSSGTSATARGRCACRATCRTSR